MNDWASFTDLSIEPRRSRLGLAVYARAFVPAGAVLVRLGIGEITETRNFRTIELGEGAHEDHPYLRYVNHSCDPNSFIDKNDRVLRALRPQAGEATPSPARAVFSRSFFPFVS